MKIGYLGAGCWGFCLANLLAGKGYQVISWTTKGDLAKTLNEGGEHPLLPGWRIKGDLRFTTQLSEALEGADMIVESVTSAGLRPVFTLVADQGIPRCPIILTSKGIEQNSGLILPDVVCQVLGEEAHHQVGFLSGPGYAKEVIQGLPTSVVGSAYDAQVMRQVCDLFTTPTFRVYPNADIRGVAFGGALKNIIAIACGISDGLELGSSSKAALMTRGLHEMRKLAMAEGCRLETLYGLAGMGDLCVTCSSTLSRNYRFGMLLAQGVAAAEARQKIGMVVEGAYTCLSALQLAKQKEISMPISEAVYKIIEEGMDPREAVKLLMQRTIKEEHL
jgi:glycerol-3-phosphate dehydrogenase (NAD(P)+)